MSAINIAKLMKNLLIFASMLAATSAAAAKMNRIEGTATAEGAQTPIVQNIDIKDHTVTVKFDLTKKEGKTPVSARLGLLCKSAETPATSPSLTFSYKGKEFAGYTLTGKGKTQETRLNVAPIILEAIKRGEKTAEFKIYSKAPPNSVPQVEILKATLFIAADNDVYSFDDIMTPIFDGTKMFGESVFPLKNADGSNASAKLFFKPKKIEAAYTYKNWRKEYLLENVDYKIDGDNVEFTDKGKFKSFDYSKIYADTKEAAAKNGKFFFFENLGKFAFFTEGGWFQQNAVFFDYEHAAQTEFSLPKRDGKTLEKTAGKLKRGEPLKIVLFGDSIAAGANAQSMTDTPPFAPTWGEIITMRLRQIYKGEIEYRNRALGGTTIGWGNLNIENLVLPDNPDLVIIAFGMNDSCVPELRAKLLKSMTDKVLKKNPDAEFIIVSSMCANPLWLKKFKIHDEYAKIDKTLKLDNVAIADVRSAHKALLSKKKYIDMTGNNVNHPNQFLIRVYAQTILNLLAP